MSTETARPTTADLERAAKKHAARSQYQRETPNPYLLGWLLACINGAGAATLADLEEAVEAYGEHVDRMNELMEQQS